MTTEPLSEIRPNRILQLASGYAAPFIIDAALRHGIFDLLDAGPRTINELSEASGASVRGLTAVVNALLGLELLRRDDAGRLCLSAESSAFLVSSRADFQGGVLARFSEYIVPRWMRLKETVATGKPTHAINQEGPGTQFFRDLVLDLFPRNYQSAKALARNLFAEHALRPGDSVLDIAAGSGVWGIALAQESKEIRVTAVDWPGVIPITRETAASYSVLDQFTFREGDVADSSFGSGYAVAVLGHILHSEGERRSRELIANVFRALRHGGIIAIAEYLVTADRTGPLSGLFFAVNMLINTDEGDSYSFEEICRWLSEAGFVQSRRLEVPGPSQVILATKPEHR